MGKKKQSKSEKEITEIRVQWGMALMNQEATQEERADLYCLLRLFPSNYKNEVFEDVLIAWRRGIDPLRSVYVTQALLDMGAKINGQTNFLWCPLVQTIAKGYIGTFLLLVERGADVNLKSPGGFRPLDYVLWGLSSESTEDIWQHVIRVLLRNGARRGEYTENLCTESPTRVSVYQYLEAMVLLRRHNLFFSDGVRMLRDFLL